jgi:hypothetical protein
VEQAAEEVAPVGAENSVLGVSRLGEHMCLSDRAAGWPRLEMVAGGAFDVNGSSGARAPRLVSE